jgi:hypothetical protein
MKSKVIALVIISCTLLASCASQKISQSHTETSVLTRHDTIYQDRIVTKTVTQTIIEKIKQQDSVSVVVDSLGNIKRTDHWHNTIINHDTQLESTLRDSINIYKALYQNLLIQRQDSIEKPIYIEKKQTFFDRFKSLLATTAAIAVVCIIGYAIWRIHRKQ